jgi:hypothetical protein
MHKVGFNFLKPNYVERNFFIENIILGEVKHFSNLIKKSNESLLVVVNEYKL